MNTTDVLIATFIMAAVTLFTRAFPFVFYRKRTPSKLVRYLGGYLPPVMITLLVLYALKDVAFTDAPFGLPEIICCVVVAGLYLWKHNPFVSIFGGTGLYMVLVQTNVLGSLLS